MAGGIVLLLLAAPAFLSLVKCHQNLQVSMSPNLTQVFIGDLIYLSCDDSTNETSQTVNWYVNATKLKWNNKILRIAAAATKDSGSYECEINGRKSGDFPINVIEYAPSASLTIETGHPVMQTGSSVILNLENDDGLKGWFCWVYRGMETRRIQLRVKDNPRSLNFQPLKLSVPETIFWCTDETKECRSNQVTVRTSNKRVSLEMYPLPAVTGESLTLRCLVWGTNKISTSGFYKNNTLIKTVSGSTYKIDSMTESKEGNYKCEATYKYVAQTVPSHIDTSDAQDIPAYVGPVRADLSEDMFCSCPSCDSRMSNRYYKKDGDSWTMLLPDQRPDSSGTYRCRAVMVNMRTLPSHSLDYKPSISTVMIVIIIAIPLIGLVIFAVAFYMWYKKRHSTGPVYEDVALRLQGDPKSKDEGEYDTIQPETAGGGRRGGEYEALKKEKKEAEYDTLKVEGASDGEGRYQELQKRKGKEDVYHTLDQNAAERGEGGYQALKKEGMQKEEYETLKVEGALKGEGEYQELQKGKEKEDVYHTLDQNAAE